MKVICNGIEKVCIEKGCPGRCFHEIEELYGDDGNMYMCTEIEEYCNLTDKYIKCVGATTVFFLSFGERDDDQD